MKSLRLCLPGVIVASGLLLTPSARADGLPKTYTLGRFIPADVWMYIHGVHNDERAFLEKEWGEVFDAFMASGVLDEFKTLMMSQMGEEERTEAEGALSTALTLIKQVDWAGLASREAAFAYRLNDIKMGPNGEPSPDFFDYIALFRGSPESMDKNTEGLVAILKQLADLSEEVTLEQPDPQKSHWKLGIAGAPFSFQLVRRDDVIGLFMGGSGGDDVLRLMSGSSDIKSIVSSERFQTALSKATAPEDSVVYFDVRRVASTVGGYLKMAAASAKDSNNPDATAWLGMAGKLLDLVDVMDYVIVTEETQGKRALTHEVAVVRTDRMDSPLIKMVSDRKPFDKFDTYIPAEATGFSVGGGIDMERLYNLILQFVRSDVPGGADGIRQMEEWMTAQDFDPQRDIFSWWSGEYVMVTLPSAMATQMGGADGVILIRVKDVELAKKKLDAGFARLQKLLTEAQQGQMVSISPASDVEAEGFQAINSPMLMMMGGMLQPRLGFHGEWMVFGTTPAAVNKCLKTAKGEAPSVLKNERFAAEGLVPKGPVSAVSFTDLSNLAQEMTQMMMGFAMAGAFLPPQPEVQPIRKVFQIMTKLGPVVQHLDFFSSQSSICMKDGPVWKTQSVITYKATAGETKKPAEASGSKQPAESGGE